MFTSSPVDPQQGSTTPSRGIPRLSRGTTAGKAGIVMDGITNGITSWCVKFTIRALT